MKIGDTVIVQRGHILNPKGEKGCIREITAIIKSSSENFYTIILLEDDLLSQFNDDNRKGFIDVVHKDFVKPINFNEEW